MLFNSFLYIVIFLPIVSIIYFILLSKKKIKLQKIWIIISSLFFYSLSSFRYLPFFLFSIIFNYVISIYINKKTSKKKNFLLIGILFNVIALGYFKYTNFLIDNINFLFKTNINLMRIAFPLAISFYTFQQIMYLVDTYHNTIENLNFMNYLLFVSFFPQLIAGPITTYNAIISQVENKDNQSINNENIFKGELLFFIGLFKKIIISDYFLTFANLGFNQIDELTIISGWFTSLSYIMQLYFDFSALSDMALGSALLFNINLPINFNSPYKSLNIQDFWGRWHISLSYFLKNYIYIPLGGSRKGDFRTYLNILAIFFVSGIWHGSAWNYIIWGLLNGFASIIYRLWKKTNIKLNKFFSWFLTFMCFNFTCIIFKTLDFKTIKKIFISMFNIKSILSLPEFKAKYYLKDFNAHSIDILILLFVIISTTILPNSNEIIQKIKIKTKSQSYIYSVIFAIIAILLIAKMVMKPYTEFIYSTF